VRTTLKLIEKLAELEHDQWMKWTSSLIRNEVLSPILVSRWKKLHIDYSHLCENEKNKDRHFAILSMAKTFEHLKESGLFHSISELSKKGEASPEAIEELVRECMSYHDV